MHEKLFCIAGLPTLPDGLTRDLLECNSNDECPRRLGKCHFMFSQTFSGKKGFCVPTTCQSNVECPSFGDECTSGRLSGMQFIIPRIHQITKTKSIHFSRILLSDRLAIQNWTDFYILTQRNKLTFKLDVSSICLLIVHLGIDSITAKPYMPQKC